VCVCVCVCIHVMPRHGVPVSLSTDVVVFACFRCILPSKSQCTRIYLNAPGAGMQKSGLS
jgi:hypothetical protein